MEKQNFQLLAVGLGALIVGLLIGCIGPMHGLGKRGSMEVGNMMMHQMPDGSVMRSAMVGKPVTDEKNKTSDATMQGMMHTMTAGLSGKTGDDFDKAFLDEMVIHHQGAIDMAQMVLKVSQRADLKKLATDVITAQTTEIEMMTKWRTTWFGQ